MAKTGSQVRFLGAVVEACLRRSRRT